MKKFFLLIITLVSTLSFSNVKYNVFLKFDNKMENEVEKISKELKKYGIDSLKSTGHVVHLTLYLTEYEEDELDDIKEVIDDIASRTEKFDLEFVKFTKTAGNWFFLDPVNTLKLQILSDEVVARLLSEREEDAKVPDWAKNIPEKVKSFKTYGSPNVFANFNPHITLLTPPKDVKALDSFISNYKLTPFRSKAVAIGVAKVDDMGQAKEQNVLYLKELK